MHMAYFAALALLVVYSDRIVILAAAATVAVHHVVLGALIPTVVFGTATGFERVALHAIILAIEAGTLMWVTTNFVHMANLSGRSLEAANLATAEARALGAVAEQARAAEVLAHSEAGSSAEQARLNEREVVLNSFGAAISSLHDGDLVHRIDRQLPSAYERLRSEFNDAVAKLGDTLRQVATSAAVIGSGTGELATASDDLARRTESQAASLEETAAALGEITGTVRRTADGAMQARTVVGGTRENAEQSGEVVRQAVEAMGAIESSAREISQIIGVIDEIAFQTNLLALNAGVEAARAGDAGRGFAVVASEVRALAQRSAAAAKQIKGLIQTSGHHVERGVSLVGETGEALLRIVDQVAEIDGVVREIAAATVDQATSLDQVNIAIRQIDQVTQQNAAMIDQAKSATSSLAREGDELVRLIGAFKMDAVEDTSGRMPPPRAGLARGSQVPMMRRAS
jgi:methyl-accepting chemotaxis protein